MKKTLSLLLALSLVLSLFCLPAAAAGTNEISVYLDGQRLTFDQPPVAMNNRTLVPLRAIFEGLGATVDWNGEKQTILATRGDTAIMLQLGVPSMAKQVGNGAIQYIQLDVAPLAMNNRTLVPVRAISEAFDCQVLWDGAANRVDISTAGDNRMVFNPMQNPDIYYGNAMFDGNTLYFSFVRRTQVYVYDGVNLQAFNAGGTPMNILPRDGKAYYYTAGGQVVYCLDTATGERTALFNQSGELDIEEIYLYRNYLLVQSTHQIHAINLDTRQSVLLHDDAAITSYLFLACAGGKIAIVDTGGFITKPNEVPFTLRFADPDTGESQVVFTTEEFPGSLNYFHAADGSGVYLRLGDESSYHFFDIETGNEQAISTDEFEEARIAYNLANDITWTPDWYYGSNVNSGVRRTSRDGSGMKEILYSGADCYYLTNNQSKVVFLQSPGATKAGASSFGNSSVYIMDLNGNNVVEIINNGESGTGTSESTGSSSENSTPQPTTCTICNGKGWVDCPVCHGSGASFSGGNCLFCGGGGLRQCSSCHGSGTLYPHV